MARLMTFFALFLICASASADQAYDHKFIKDYTARGYFISGTAGDLIDQNTNGVTFPFSAGWEPDNDSGMQKFNHLSSKYIYQLNRALDRLPAYPKAEIYRGIYSTNEDQRPEQRYFKGRVWIERRYQSSTMSLKVAEKFAAGKGKNEGCGGCSADIKNPKHKNMVVITILHRSGKDISKIGAKDEKEVLLKSGLLFKVVEAKRDAKRRYIVKLQELDPAKLSEQDRNALAISEELRHKKLVDKYYGGDQAKLVAAIPAWNALNGKLLNEGFYERDDFDWETWVSESGE